MTKRILVQTLAVAMVSSTCAFAADGDVTLGTGLTYSTGNYGTSTTSSITSVPFTARYETGLWNFKATVPYLEIDGASSVVPGIGVVANSNPRGRGRVAGTATTGSSASGLGDVVFSATRTMYYDAASKFGFDLTGKVKFGTADKDRGLGTGENDYGLHFEPYKTFGQTTVFGSVGYTHLGSSDFIKLDNVVSASIGASHKLDADNTLGASFDARQRSSSTGFAQRDVTAFYAKNINRSWKAQIYVLKGFADGSPDWGAGATLAYAL